MRFAYLVQSPGALPEVFAPLLGREDARVFHLTWREPVSGATHLPGSTWTEGRNALIEAARAFEPDYYVLCDDDLGFLEGDWEIWEAELAWHCPPVATAHLPPYYRRQATLTTHTVYSFDALMNAFHRDLVEDGVVLPYLERFDPVTWWLSQLFVIHLCGAFYPGRVLCFNNVAVANREERPYPRSTAATLHRYGEWFREAAFDSPELAARVRPLFDDPEAQGFDPPPPPLASYRLTAKAKAGLRSRWWRASPPE